jgi:hypothetical protein
MENEALLTKSHEQIIRTDNACPVCKTRITTPGDYMGVWDGSMGDGSGNWYSKKCEVCGSMLVGWQYRDVDEAVDRIRWEARVSAP